jgi:hypothetical protein
MNKIIRILILGMLSVTVYGELPEAPEGFKWKKFSKAEVELRVPKQWNIYQFKLGKAKVLQITKDEKTDTGFDTGLTLQYIACSSAEEYSDAVKQAGEFMANLHDQFSELEVSQVYDKGGRLNMILEGTRKIPERNNDVIYRTRTCVRAFHEARSVYIYVFGAPLESYNEDFEVSEIMLNPILFLDGN